MIKIPAELAIRARAPSWFCFNSSRSFIILLQGLLLKQYSFVPLFQKKKGVKNGKSQKYYVCSTD